MTITDTSLQEDKLAESSLVATSPTVLHSSSTPDNVSTADDTVSDIDTPSPLTDAESDETVDDELRVCTPWEPPPGFCWTCWMDFPGMDCPKHPK